MRRSHRPARQRPADRGRPLRRPHLQQLHAAVRGPGAVLHPYQRYQRQAALLRHRDPRRGRQPGPHLYSGPGQRGGRGRRLSGGCRRPAHPGQHQTAQQRCLSPGSPGPRCQSALRQRFGHLYRDPSGGHCRQHPGRDRLRGPALKSHTKKQHLLVLLFSSRFHEKSTPGGVLFFTS